MTLNAKHLRALMVLSALPFATCQQKSVPQRTGVEELHDSLASLIAQGRPPVRRTFAKDPGPPIPEKLRVALSRAELEARQSELRLALAQASSRLADLSLHASEQEVAQADAVHLQATAAVSDIRVMGLVAVRGFTREVSTADKAMEASRTNLEHRRQQRDAANAAAAIVERDYATKSQALEAARAAVEQWRQASASEAPAFGGLTVERASFIIQFRASAKPSAVNDLIDRYRLQVEGGDAEARLLFVRLRGPDASPAPSALRRLERVIGAVRRQAIVTDAVENLPMTGQLMPKKSDLVAWDWCSSSTEASATHYLAQDRFPQAWNFIDAIKRRNGVPVRVGVVDQGFSKRLDVPFENCRECPGQSAAHGNQVLGIIGAKFNTGTGIDGACPFAQLVACAVDPSAPLTPGAMEVINSMTDVYTAVKRLQRIGNVRVLNLSIGYNWKDLGPTERPALAHVKDAVARQGRFVQELARDSPNILIVSAAGNDQMIIPNFEAMFGSPFNWAALNVDSKGHQPDNIVVVEALAVSGGKAPYSNSGGNIAAPGDTLVSTAVSGFSAMSGTSAAAPQVAAAAAMMLAYNPALSPQQVARIMTHTPSGGAPAHLDAFEAMVESSDSALHDLADLNADGVVDERDFAIFVAAMKDAIAKKKTDPCAAAFSRADLNGSGILSIDDSDKVMVNGHLMGDLDVMVAAWQGTTIAASALHQRLQEELKGQLP